DEFDPATPVMCDGDHHPVRLQATLEHVGRRLVVFDDYHASCRCVRADSVLYRLHFFFVFLVPSVSPRSQRIATMNFDVRSSRVLSLRYAWRSTAQCGSSQYHFISSMTSATTVPRGSDATGSPSYHGLI